MITVNVKISPDCFEPGFDRKASVSLTRQFNFKAIDAITKISFLHLIEEKEKKGLPYILAFVEHAKGKIFPYDAIALDRSRRAHIFKKISPEKIRRIHYYTIQSFKDESFKYIGTVDKNSSSVKNEIYFLLATNQSDTAEGKYLIGISYEMGKGVRFDRKKAYEFYEESSNLGHSLASLKMAEKFARGIDEETPDERKMFYYCKRAADSGDKYAQYDLGKCYSQGLGTERDDVKAFEYYKASAKNKYTLAELALGNCYRQGKGTDKKPFLAVNYFKKAAAKENISAIHCLAMCYSKGMGVDKNLEEAYKLCFIAAGAGLLSARCNIGRCYEYGLGVERNYSLAFLHYKIAADAGYINAFYKLGCCYEHGRGTEKNRHHAHLYYRKAACLGNVRALRKIETLDLEWFNSQSL